MVKKRKKTKEETANQPFYRGLFGIKGSKKKISSTLGGLKTRRPRSSNETLQVKGSFTHVEVQIPRRRWEGTDGRNVKLNIVDNQ